MTLYLVCRIRNDSGDEYVDAHCATPEHVAATEAEATHYVTSTAPLPVVENGTGNTIGFDIYRIDFPASPTPVLVRSFDRDDLGIPDA